MSLSPRYTQLSHVWSEWRSITGIVIAFLIVCLAVFLWLLSSFDHYSRKRSGHSWGLLFSQRFLVVLIFLCASSVSANIWKLFMLEFTGSFLELIRRRQALSLLFLYFVKSEEAQAILLFLFPLETFCAVLCCWRFVHEIRRANWFHSTWNATNGSWLSQTVHHLTVSVSSLVCFLSCLSPLLFGFSFADASPRWFCDPCFPWLLSCIWTSSLPFLPHHFSFSDNASCDLDAILSYQVQSLSDGLLCTEFAWCLILNSCKRHYAMLLPLSTWIRRSSGWIEWKLFKINEDDWITIRVKQSGARREGLMIKGWFYPAQFIARVVFSFLRSACRFFLRSSTTPHFFFLYSYVFCSSFVLFLPHVFPMLLFPFSLVFLRSIDNDDHVQIIEDTGTLQVLTRLMDEECGRWEFGLRKILECMSSRRIEMKRRNEQTSWNQGESQRLTTGQEAQLESSHSLICLFTFVFALLLPRFFLVVSRLDLPSLCSLLSFQLVLSLLCIWSWSWCDIGVAFITLSCSLLCFSFFSFAFRFVLFLDAFPTAVSISWRSKLSCRGITHWITE